MAEDTAAAGMAEQRHYFVDEAGDGTLFDAKGRVIVGTEGCSRHFMLGMVDIPDPDALARDLEALRASLLADPYFRGVPSMDPEKGRTALFFHAKDDPAEVRREVYRVLLRHGLRFCAVVRDKRRCAEIVREANGVSPGYRYHPNHVYDNMVRHLFAERLHLADVHHVHFARRGKSDRTEALREALSAARDRFVKGSGQPARGTFEV